MIFPSFLLVVLILLPFLDEILMPRDSSTNYVRFFSPPVVHNAFVVGYNYFVVSKVCAGLGGTVVRGCASRSLLGSYIHQDLI